MKKYAKKYAGLLLIFSLIMGTLPGFQGEAAKKKPCFSKKKITITVKKKKKIKIKNAKKIKTTVWSVKNKKIVKLSKKKKTSVILKGRKKGKTVVTARVKRKGKKKPYKLKLKVTVKNAEKIQTSGKPPAPVKTAGTIPPTAVPSAIPPTAVSSAKPTPSATPRLEDRSMKELYEDSFMMGAAINGNSAQTAAIRHEGMAGILKKHYNSTTLSNLMKPCFLLDEEACKKAAADNGDDVTEVDVTFDSCKESLDFCKENGIRMRGHVLVWHDQTPEWFFKKGYDAEKEYVSKEVMEKRLENYIKKVLTYCQTNYPGVIYCWDVVNECVDNVSPDTTDGWSCRTKFNGSTTHWYQIMGLDYVYKSFEYARKYADKDVKLIYNEYNVFQKWKRESIVKLLSILKEKGWIDGVGLQPTVGLTYPAELKGSGTESFETCLREYGKLGLDIQVTELSFEIPKDKERSEANLKLQADRYEEMFKLLLEMDDDNGGPCHITSVSIFGICDDYPLYDDHKQCLYLWNKDGTPKEAYYRVHTVGEHYFAQKNGISITGGQ